MEHRELDGSDSTVAQKAWEQFGARNELLSSIGRELALEFQSEEINKLLAFDVGLSERSVGSDSNVLAIQFVCKLENIEGKLEIHIRVLVSGHAKELFNCRDFVSEVRTHPMMDIVLV
jgi:hypothetical protein